MSTRDDLDYHVIKRGSNPNHPLLEWISDASPFYKSRPVQVTEPIRLRLGAPIPRKMVMADYHSLPDPVVSKKIFDVLEPMNLPGVQLVPAMVRMKDDSQLPYWLIHAYRKIICIDRERSICEWHPRFSDRITDVTRLVLSERVMDEIPLSERLVFRVAERSFIHLFHRTVRDAILAVSPDGVRFIPLDQYNEGSAFRP